MENLKLKVSSTPHIREKNSIEDVMLDVIIALMPAAIASVIFFGFKALLMIVVSVASAITSEFFFNLITKKRQTVGDYSAIITGLLLALTLPVTAELWHCMLGSIFAIVVVKCLFGGLGKNIVNPAITARVFMLLTFANTVAGGAAPVSAELTSSATPLVTLNQGAEAASSIKLMDLFLGNHAGAIGENENGSAWAWTSFLG